MPEDSVYEEGRYRTRKHQMPSSDLKYQLPYDWQGPELQALQQFKSEVVLSQVLDLTTVRTFQNPLVVTAPGRAVAIFGINTSSGAAYDPVANTGTEPVAAGAFVFCRFQTQDSQASMINGLPLKHNRGFRGPFQVLYLSWPAQANTNCRLVVYKCEWVPWQNGEAAT